jgi:hypothetical protein
MHVQSIVSHLLHQRGTVRFQNLIPACTKLLYALLITSHKLLHYFQSLKITMVTNFPLGDILHNRDAIGHISKWAVELGALNIDFTLRKAIKS